VFSRATRLNFVSTARRTQEIRRYRQPSRWIERKQDGLSFREQTTERRFSLKSMAFNYSHPDIRRAVEDALAEDIGSGDITTNACIPAELHAEAKFIAKQDLTLAGVELLELL